MPPSPRRPRNCSCRRCRRCRARKPDLVGTDIIPNGYTVYPKEHFKAIATPPGKGGDVTLVTTFSNPVAPYDSNTLWQGVSKALNVNLKLNLVPFSDYSFGKFQTIVAGDDLPDLLFVPIGGVIPELPSFLEGKCADLTPFLSGDAVKEFPYLGTLPTMSWKNAVFNGKIFGVPIALSVFYWALWVHQNLLEEVGGQMPKSADDFKRMLLELNRPQAGLYGIGFEVGNRYAYSLTTTGGTFFPAIFGAPNNWSESGGKFTKDFETEEFKASVGFARDLFAAGVFDPNTTYTTPTANNAFYGRKLAFRFLGLTAPSYEGSPSISAGLNPPYEARLVPAFPAQAGGKALLQLWTRLLRLDGDAQGEHRPRQRAAWRLEFPGGPDRQRGAPAQELRHRGQRLPIRRQGQSDPNPTGCREPDPVGQRDQLRARAVQRAQARLRGAPAGC